METSLLQLVPQRRECPGCAQGTIEAATWEPERQRRTRRGVQQGRDRVPDPAVLLGAEVLAAAWIPPPCGKDQLL